MDEENYLETYSLLGEMESKRDK